MNSLMVMESAGVKAAWTKRKSTVAESSTIIALGAFSTNRAQKKQAWKTECNIDWEYIYRIIDCSDFK